ncbi:hypothetical protein [Vibrio diazotrophicus]|uniref:hypothetical protein n=1 Tax=Vibrio diazotrophicus TaxID=685 RepID=UPI00142DA8EA|nr:hypothetical protein [Vibrio diazotrophicus]NIY91148.1 hypothetical protein [Vibrio diazotrophicus]
MSKKSLLEDLLLELYDLIDHFVWLGIGVSALFSYLTVIAMIWAGNVSYNVDGVSANYLILFHYARWFIPLTLLFLAYMFISKTYVSWQKNR